MHDVGMEYCGSTTIGERGQVVLPAALRARFKVKKGDKFLVLTGRKMGAWGVIMVKADIMNAVLAGRFGPDLQGLFKKR